MERKSLNKPQAQGTWKLHEVTSIVTKFLKPSDGENILKMAREQRNISYPETKISIIAVFSSERYQVRRQRSSVSTEGKSKTNLSA